MSQQNQRKPFVQPDMKIVELGKTIATETVSMCAPVCPGETIDDEDDVL